MATRNTQGFGAGFASGYGLVQEQAQDNRRSDYLDERNRIDSRGENNRSKESQLRLGLQKTQAETAGINANTASLNANTAAAKAVTDGVTAQSQADYRDSQIKKQDLESEILQSNFDETNRLIGEQQEFRSTNAQVMASVDSVNAVENYFNQSIENGTYTPEGMKAQLDQLNATLAQNPGAKGISLESQFSPVMMGTIEQFREGVNELAQGGEPGKAALIDMANLYFRGNHEQGVGDLVTEATHSEAYPEMIADGSYRITSKRIGDAEPAGFNADGQQQFRVTLDVTAVNEKGQKVVYPASMTQSRNGAEGSEEVLLTAEELFKPAAGYMSWNKHSQRYKSFAQQARIRTDPEFANEDDTGYSSGKYDLWLNDKITDYRKESVDKENQPSGIPGMSRQDLMNDKEKLKDYFITERYDAGSLLPTTDKNPVDDIMNRIMDNKDIKKLESLVSSKTGKPLSRRQILRAQQFMTVSNTGEVVLDPKKRNGWGEYRNNVMGRPPRRPNPTRGN